MIYFHDMAAWTLGRVTSDSAVHLLVLSLGVCSGVSLRCGFQIPKQQALALGVPIFSPASAYAKLLRLFYVELSKTAGFGAGRETTSISYVTDCAE